MDKLVPVIEFFKKYGFWILCSIIALSSIGVWFMASGAIDKKNRDLTSKIEQSFKTGKNLQGTFGEEDIRKHPNTTSEEGMQQEIDRVAESLVKAWGKRYESQAKLKVWPEEVKSQNAEFVSTFEKFKLPETFPEDFEANNIITLLEIYKIHIPKVMARISKIIGTQWEHDPEEDEAEDDEGDESGEGGPGGLSGGRPAGSGASPGGGGRGDRGRGKKKPATTIDSRVVCEWNSENQLVWDSKLTSFEARDDNKLGADNIPTPSQIYMLQQDLWLLESMFNVIRKVNSREKDGVNMVKANDLATVKRIDHIAFGREALAKLGDITDIVVEEENERGSGIGREGPPRGRSRGNKGADSGYGEIDYSQKPAFHARYVDKEMTKVYTAEEIRKALSPGTTLPAGEELGLLVARRVPVRLAVKIDETKIPEFVAACADSPFPFKVNQVRVNKHEANGGIVHAGGGSGPSGAKKKKKSRELAAAGQNELGGGAASKSALENESVETRTNYDVNAEFFGYITVYNPVDEARLTGKKPEAGAEEDATNPKP